MISPPEIYNEQIQSLYKSPDCLLLFIIVEKMQDTRATAVGDYISTSARD